MDRRRVLQTILQPTQPPIGNIYASRVFNDVSLNYQGVLTSYKTNKVFEFKLDVNRSYEISQISDTIGYCRIGGWSDIPLEIGGQSYKGNLTTIGVDTALSGRNFNNLSGNARVIVAKAPYLYTYNQGITTDYSDHEVYINHECISNIINPMEFDSTISRQMLDFAKGNVMKDKTYKIVYDMDVEVTEKVGTSDFKFWYYNVFRNETIFREYNIGVGTYHLAGEKTGLLSYSTGANTLVFRLDTSSVKGTVTVNSFSMTEED